MELESIGKNIRKFRLAKNLRQEQLAEKTGLSTNYIGMIERGEKVPALETFISLANALGVSADMLLSEVIDSGYQIKSSLLTDQLAELSDSDRALFYDVFDAILKHTGNRNS